MKNHEALNRSIKVKDILWNKGYRTIVEYNNSLFRKKKTEARGLALSAWQV